MKKNIKLLGLVFLSAATVAHATGEGMYMGAQVGGSKLNNPTKNVVINPTGTTVVISPSNTGVGARLYAGYQLNEYFGGEIGYTYYTPSKYNATSFGGNTLCSDPTIKESTLDFLAKAMYPVWNFNVFGKAGMAIAYQSSSGSLVNNTGNCGSQGKAYTAVAPAYSVGASYDLTPSWQVDISFSQVLKTTNIPTATLFAIGFSYHIVDRRCGQFLC